jgi:hypothetical protein
MEKDIPTTFDKAFRVSLKLKEGAPPHIYTPQLKKFMEDDTSLHPMMNRTLKLLKKTHTPYIQLSMLREVVFDCPNLRHFDRSADPVGNWVCTLWAPEEVEDYKKNPEEYIRIVLKFFKLLGYELYDSSICKPDYMAMLQDVTSKQIKAQEKGR